MLRKFLVSFCVVSSLAAMKQREPMALDGGSGARTVVRDGGRDGERGLAWRLARAVAFYIRDGAQFDKELIEALCKEGADHLLVLDGYDWGISYAPHFKGSILDYANFLCIDSNEAIQTRAVEVKFSLLDRNDRATVKNPTVMRAQVLPASSRGSSCTPLVSFALVLGGSILVLAIQAYR